MMAKNWQRSIGKEKAIALAESGWWKELTPHDIVRVQFYTAELCMDFGDFHGAMEQVLGRPVWTHEFADFDRLKQEMDGDKPAPTLEEIMNLIPVEKRIVVEVQ